MSKSFSGVTAPNLIIFVHDIDSHIQCTSKLPIGVPIFQCVLEWQRDKKNFPRKTPIFRFRWLSWQRPLSDCQVGAKFMKPLRNSTNP